MEIHVVRPGENLWMISQRYRVSMNQIALMNELPDPNRLVAGQALVIPTPFREYVVQPGENLWIIAQRFGMSVQDIMQANNITNPDIIYPGQVLLLPFLYHRVQPGESLWSIAGRYGITTQAILQINEIANPSFIYAGQILRIPDKTRPTIDVNAYTIEFTAEGAQDILDVGENLTYLSPFGYRIQADGGLTPIADELVLDAARRTNVVPMMSITNFTATDPGTRLAGTVLSNPQIQETLLNNIITTMRNKGYRGLSIDFENVAPENREQYNEFLRRSVNRLHPLGYFVSSAVAPKYSGTQTGLLYEAHDYPAHGEILDFVILMTYEWGYRLGPPQAISPLDQIRRVLDYAVTVIPRNKIFMGFQLYARDWLLPHVRGQEAETFSMQEAVRRAVRYGAVIQYDQRSQTPFYRYADERGRNHEVWFEDARSAQAKFDTVKEYNLRGISYWVLGYPFPQNWALLKDNFNVRKL